MSCWWRSTQPATVRIKDCIGKALMAGKSHHLMVSAGQSEPATSVDDAQHAGAPGPGDNHHDRHRRWTRSFRFEYPPWFCRF
jgi:hypothetical protein